MKKFSCLLLLVTLLAFNKTYSQSALPKGEKQLNAGLGFSNLGTPVYIGVDFAVHDDITVGPQMSYRGHNLSGFNFSILTIGATGNYHFNTLLDIPSDFDFYAGLTLAYYSWSSPTGFGGASASGIGLEAQIGGRYYFDSKWGANIEFGGGNTSGGKIGISYKF